MGCEIKKAEGSVGRMRDEENEGWLEQEKEISVEGKGGWQSYLYFVREMRKEIRAREHDCMEKITKRRCVCHVWGGVSRLIQGVGECGSLVKTKACVNRFIQQRQITCSTEKNCVVIDACRVRFH